MICCIFFLLLAACGSGDGGNGTSSILPIEAAVNGFGSATNHVHSLISPEPHVLLLATHFGTYRSIDTGKTWKRITGGDKQLMQGLMDYSLSASPLDPQRLYMMAIAAVTGYKGIQGLYRSDDGGENWQLASRMVDLKSANVFFDVAGNQSADEVYIYLPDQGDQGLKVSHDGGKHFSSTSMLPFGSLLGLLPLPNKPGQLLAYGNDGLARSVDGGRHWQVLKSPREAVTSMVMADAHMPVYASSDDGIYASHDDGQTFELMSKRPFTSLNASPTNPLVLYGKTGQLIYRSQDGGRTWKALPRLKGNLGDILVDSRQPLNIFLSLSYPVAVYRFDGQHTTWSSLTPAP